MPKVEFKRVETDAEVENIDIKDGQLIYSKSGKTYMDYGDERIATGSGGGSVNVDTEMSDISENAVQNKVIKEYVDDQVNSIPEEVIVSDTQPTGDDWKLWIDSDKQTDNTYYNDNGTPTNIKTTTYDTLPVGTEVDYDGETVPDGWTQVDEEPIYSTTEQVCGTWYDGKPLYQRVVYINSLPNNSTGYYDVFNSSEINNINVCFIDEGNSYMTVTAGNHTETDTMNWIYSTSGFVMTCIYDKQIRIITKDNKSTTSAYVTVKYTKTTD